MLAANTDGGGALVADPPLTDLGEYLLSWSCQRGRSSEFTRVEAGSASAQLKNQTGAFDITNTGTHFNLLPQAPVQFAFANPITGGDPIPVFTGYADDWDNTRQGPTRSTVTATMTDGFRLIGGANVNPAANGRVYGAYYAAQHVDDRIRAALADMGWPATKTKIAQGNVNLQAANYDASAKILAVCQDAAEAEFPGPAMFFMGPDGRAVFTGRFIRFNPDSYMEGATDVTPGDPWTARWFVGDAGAIAEDSSLLPIFDLEWTYGVHDILNDVVCAPEGATQATINANHVINADSQRLYGPVSQELLGLQVLDGSTSTLSGVQECKTYADYFISNYSAPIWRITRIEFHGQMDDGSWIPTDDYLAAHDITVAEYAASIGKVTPGSLWDFILHVDLNHILNVTTKHPSDDPDHHGGFINQEFFVEGIQHSVENLNNAIPRWTLTLDLSPRGNWALGPPGIIVPVVTGDSEAPTVPTLVDATVTG